MPGDRLLRLYFPNLGRGMSGTAPPRSMTPDSKGPLWRDMRNLVIDDGYLAKRPCLQGEYSVGASYDTPSGSASWVLHDKDNFHGGTDQFSNAQTPFVIRSYDNGRYLLIVTSQEIWWARPGNSSPFNRIWVNLTPIYTTGTVTVTNGSKSVTGSGTSWQTLGLGRGQIFETSGDGATANIIDSVSSDTALTLRDNYDGTPGGAGISYEIRRCFNALAPFEQGTGPAGGVGFPTPIFADVYNGDLFVAGPIGHKNLSGASTGPGDTPAVLKVPDVFGRPANTDVEWLAAQFDLDGGGGFEVLAEWRTIVGMQYHPDSRIMLVLWTEDASNTTTNNRLYFSSNVDHTVWQSSPGGFSDLTHHPGRITGFEKLGRAFTFHFGDSGIVLGHPSGEANTPLNFQVIPKAETGAINTRTIKNTRLGQIFLSADYRVCVFDGNRVVGISDDVRDILGENVNANSPGHLPGHFASVDTFLHKYRLFLGDWTGTHAGTMIELEFNYQTGQWTRHDHAQIIGAASDLLRSNEESRGGHKRSEGTAWIGLHSYLPELTTESNPSVYGLRANIATDTSDIDNNGGISGGFYVESDDQDAGLPGVDKIWERAILWVDAAFGGASTEQIDVSLSTDGGDTWTTESVTATVSATGEDQILHFSFDPITAEKIRFKIEANSSTELKSRFKHFMLIAMAAADTLLSGGMDSE